MHCVHMVLREDSTVSLVRSVAIIISVGGGALPCAIIYACTFAA